jgi:hypothetical protein
LTQFAKAAADLEAALKLKPDDFDTTQRMAFVQAKLASPRPVAAAPVATPAPPPPEGMSMQMKIGLGVAALIVIIIIAIILSRRKSRGY